MHSKKSLAPKVKPLEKGAENCHGQMFSKCNA